MRSAQIDRDGTRTITGRVLSGGGRDSFGGPGDWTSARTGTGVYTITFPSRFRVLSVQASLNQNASQLLSITHPAGTNTITVNAWTSNTGAAVDQSFAFTATGLWSV